MKLTFLTLPLSTNSLYAHVGKHRFLTSRAQSNKEAMGWEARSQYHGKPLMGPVCLKIDLYWPDARNRDVDNIKGLLDACTGILWADDGQITDLHITKAMDRANPRVEMEVWPVEPLDKGGRDAVSAPAPKRAGRGKATRH